jgi:hypothetical protein
MIHTEDQARIDEAKLAMEAATGPEQAAATNRFRVIENKAIRRALTDLDVILSRSPIKSANRMLAFRHIEDASMRLGKDLQECSEPNPYPNSKDTSNTIVDATAPEVSKLPPHQQRVIEERQELENRRQKLSAFFGTQMFESLNPAEKERMKRQHDMMEGYSTVLGERIAAF